jgi:hypothetical protein
MMIDADAACAGWYYDPLHQQPVYLFWDHATWRALRMAGPARRGAAHTGR